VPGGNPVIDVPGEVPISPVITLEPVLVIAELANKAKLAAPPKGREED